MTKKSISDNRKLVEGVLLSLTVIGSLFAMLSVAMPYLALGTLKFIDGAPDQVTFGDTLIRFAFSLIPVVPFALFLGGASAFLYTFISKDKDGKLILRIWGTVMIILFAMSVNLFLRQ
jgi:hypothetical protein